MKSPVCANTGARCKQLGKLKGTSLLRSQERTARVEDLQQKVAQHGCLGECALGALNIAKYLHGDPKQAFAKGVLDIVVRIGEPLLTETEKFLLVTREDRGIEPVSVSQFESLEQFKEGSNNFFLPFAAVPDSPDGYLIRRTKPFQRFAHLYPEKFTELMELQGSGSRLRLNDSAWAQLYEGYQLISQLVDVNDANVVKNGEVDVYTLCR